MTWDGYRVLAVIPARGGSKGIPRKNLQRLGGISLVARAVRLAVALPWIDRAVVSTDDEEIAEEARACGLDVPFLRPRDLSHDLATSVDTWRHAWLAAEAAWGRHFEVSLLLEPTSPLRNREDLERTVASLLEGKHRAAATVSRTPAHFTPEKTLVLREDGTLRTYLPAGEAQSLRQLIPSYFHRNGLCYAAWRKTILEGATLIESDCSAVVVSRPVVNIDDTLDLEWAQWLLDRREVESARGEHHG